MGEGEAEDVYWTEERLQEIHNDLKAESADFSKALEVYIKPFDDFEDGQTKRWEFIEPAPESVGQRGEEDDWKADWPAAIALWHKRSPLTKIRDIFSRLLMTNEHPRISKIIAMNLGNGSSISQAVRHCALAYFVKWIMEAYHNYGKPEWAQNITVVYQDSDQVYPNLADGTYFEEFKRQTSRIPGAPEDHRYPVWEHLVHDTKGYRLIDGSSLVVCFNARNPYRQIIGDYLESKDIDPAGIICMPVDSTDEFGMERHSTKLAERLLLNESMDEVDEERQEVVWKDKLYEVHDLFTEMSSVRYQDQRIETWTPLKMYLKLRDQPTFFTRPLG